ncbi:glycoside hydrolase family 3 C-terminal domain-containing protein [Pseudomonas sp. WAC2]|uniref:beta-glucosidase n=1 Tax=Pseudomonas sp. WAC2 TaxID=3055057 RepID=UPI0025AF8694|nr:glycoside hydrolase family 3 C-terminal domain-containing protein [Pseudomonas sp. WAC2]MDN3237036.1 glycoside hydrolase family 3 C-terminal domain-containing protein [Pseudomonas sp. WAC2]
MGNMKLQGAVLTALALAVGQAYAVTQANPAQVEKKVESTLGQMSLSEKLSLIGGTGPWDVKGLDKFGLPQIHGADGGVGIRYTSQDNNQGIVYPAGPNLAATWNVDRAKSFGEALGYDTRAGGYQFVTGPGANLYRSPYSGRAFEYLSGEDPYLGAVMAPAVINGIQSQGVWANAKHFVANDQETNRFTLDERIGERTLREMYLPAFESAAKNGNVAMMMCAFQLINGVYSCEHQHLITGVLKKEWGWKGLMQSDYNAVVHGYLAADAGTDLDMMGYQMNSTILTPYIQAGKLSTETINDKVRRILRQIYAYRFDQAIPAASKDMDSASSQQAALEGAREGIVLLKNKDHLLPLSSDKVKSIAVIGNLAKYAPPTGFGSANVDARNFVSELSGLKQVAGNAKVDFIDSLSLDPNAAEWTTTDASGNTEKGLKAEFFNNANWSGTPSDIRIDQHVNLDWANGNKTTTVDYVSNTTNGANYPVTGDDQNTSVRWSGSVTPTISGEQVFKVRADGAVRLYVNGQKIIDNGDGNPLPNNSIPPTIPVYGKVNLEAGKSYDIKLEYSRRKGYISTMGGMVGVQMSWASLAAPQDLSKYDAVVMAVGNSNEYEGEGFDHGFDLPEYQSQLIQNVAKVNPKTVVVMHGGTGLNMTDWVDQVDGALHAFYPGQYGGQALAEILYGVVNPSAKMPFSIEKKLQDNPVYAGFPEFDNTGKITRMAYSEGLYVGYRGYEMSGIKPLYPFGYGLSYTSFKYSNIKVTPKVVVGNAPIKVSFDVTNTGQRAGAEVAQLYIGQNKPQVARPVKELKGFGKVFLNPGETKRVTLQLNDRSLAYFNEATNNWVVDADTFKISVGAASNDIRLTSSLTNPYRQELSNSTSNPLSKADIKAVTVKAAKQ